MASTDIALMVYMRNTHRNVKVTFSTEAQALAYRDSNQWDAAGNAKYIVDEWTDENGQPNGTDLEAVAPTLFAYLYPTCEHGMNGLICSGPNHFGEADDERYN